MIFKNRPKVFCIGANKTGTTSVEKALSDLGFKMGNQNSAQALIEAYKIRDFKKIRDFCKNADAFQDAPFSWHYTGIFMDLYFKKAKFILTIRDDEEQWYKSLTQFHSKILGLDRLPNSNDLKLAKRSKDRTMWDNFNVRHDISNDDPYNEERLKKYYLDHNRMIIDYFRFKKNLLVINLSHEDSYSRFCDFLEVKPLYEKFPWENKTNEQ